MIKMTVNNIGAMMQIDTGASVNVISLEELNRRMGHPRNYCISKNCTTLSMYYGTLFKTSGAHFNPKGITFHLNLPNGVLKHVSLFDWSVRGICQNPFLASNTENT